MMHMGIGFGLLSALNYVLFLAGLAVFVLFATVLIKLNKALNIWLAEHNNKGGY